MTGSRQVTAIRASAGPEDGVGEDGADEGDSTLVVDATAWGVGESRAAAGLVDEHAATTIRTSTPAAARPAMLLQRQGPDDVTVRSAEGRLALGRYQRCLKASIPSIRGWGA